MTFRRKLPDGVFLISATLTGPLLSCGSLYLNPFAIVDQLDDGRRMHCVPPGVSAMLNDAPFSDGSPETVPEVFFDRYTSFFFPDDGFFTSSFFAAASCWAAVAIPPDRNAAPTPRAMIFLIGLRFRLGVSAGGACPTNGTARQTAPEKRDTFGRAARREHDAGGRRHPASG